MKRSVGPAKTLAVILSASLAMSSPVTAFATSGSLDLSGSEDDVIVVDEAQEEEVSNDDTKEVEFVCYEFQRTFLEKATQGRKIHVLTKM